MRRKRCWSVTFAAGGNLILQKNRFPLFCFMNWFCHVILFTSFLLLLHDLPLTSQDCYFIPPPPPPPFFFLYFFLFFYRHCPKWIKADAPISCDTRARSSEGRNSYFHFSAWWPPSVIYRPTSFPMLSRAHKQTCKAESFRRFEVEENPHVWMFVIIMSFTNDFKEASL